MWDIFAFEGELLVKRLDDPVHPEPPRDGEGGNACQTCDEGIAGSIWSDDRWMHRTTSTQAVPTVLLSPLEHDGGAHLHWWFTARPEGFLQLRGSSVIDWCDTLPTMPDEEWQPDMTAIGVAMAAGGGSAHPPT